MVCGTEIYKLSAAKIPLGKVKIKSLSRPPFHLTQVSQKLRKPIREAIGNIIGYILDWLLRLRSVTDACITRVGCVRN
jgi:hypothetical protein